MSPDLSYFRFILSLLLVLGLIVLCGWALRRFGNPARFGNRGPKRLGVVETLPLDPRHRLVLVRRDGVEHLLLLGPTHALLVESAAAPPGFATHLPGDPA